MFSKAKRFQDYYDDITSKFSARLLEKTATENIVFSPYSIIAVLFLLAESVDGDTKEEIARFLNGTNNIDGIKDEIEKFMKGFKGDDAFCAANAVAVRSDHADKIKDEYKKNIDKNFGARIFSSENMSRDINAWVKENTKGMIDSIGNEESMKDTLMSIMNAVAFESKWLDEYEEEDAKYGDFHNADGTQNEVVLLRSNEDEYINSKDFIGFVKPYRAYDYAFVALLPKDDKANITKLLNKIRISEIYKSRKHGDIVVRMPEFDYEYEAELQKIFEQFGVNKAFSDNADFSPMSSEWLKVNEILHKTLIKVDRNGTKAAAVTMCDMGAGCCLLLDDDFREITLDRPFVYAIVHKNSGIPLFVGITNEIKDSNIEINDKDLELEGFEPTHYKFKSLDERVDLCGERAGEIERKILPVIDADPVGHLRLRRLNDQAFKAEMKRNIRELDAINYTVDILLEISE